MSAETDTSWECFQSPDPPNAPPSDPSARGGFSRESVVRLIDAAIVMVRAAANAARVAEEVLTEHRDRMSRPPDDAGADPPPRDESRTRINLTY